jgi:hypothetical protein
LELLIGFRGFIHDSNTQHMDERAEPHSALRYFDLIMGLVGQLEADGLDKLDLGEVNLELLTGGRAGGLSLQRNRLCMYEKKKSFRNNVVTK